MQNSFPSMHFKINTSKVSDQDIVGNEFLKNYVKYEH